MVAALPAPPWPADDPFPRYSEAEYLRRWSALSKIMAEAAVQVVVVAGSGSGRAEIQHLTNAPVRWESLLVASASPETEATLFVRLDNHAVGLEPWSTVPVVPVGPGVSAAAAAEVSRRAGPGSRVGLLGPASERTASSLRAALPHASFVDLTAAFVSGRMVKGAEELAWTSYAAAVCDHAIGAFLGEARPGLREDELGGMLQSAVLAAGGQLGILFLATASMTRGGAVAPHQTWSRRLTTADDLVMFELSAGFGGTTAQILRTVGLGAPRAGPVQELHAAADRAFEHILETIGPGVPFSALESAGAIIEQAGYTIVDDLVHGYGGGYLRPHIRTPGTRREPPGEDRLEPGMLLVIQPNVVTLDGRHGIQTGELVVVTATGAESLHATPRGFLETAEAAR